MSFTRRQAIAWTAGATTTLLGVRALDQGVIRFSDSPALAAWTDWSRSRHGGPLALVAAGLLAASPHNTQPWRFAVGRIGVDIFEVPTRSLGAFDPFGRERLAGLGAAIHNMALASTRLGQFATVRLLPDPQSPVHVARIELDTAAAGRPAPHPLLPAIGQRHTHRGVWTGAPLKPQDIAALLDFSRPPEIGVHLFAAASPMGQRLAALTSDATQAITEDEAMMAASHRWFRHSRAAQDKLKDGLTLATSGVSPLIAAAAAMLPPMSASTEGKYWLEATRDVHLPSASVFGLITAQYPWDRRQALLAGMAWQRLHLIAAARGLAAQPLNQLPEMIDRQRAQGQPASFAKSARRLPGVPTFAFRLGMAETAAKPSLRRPVSQVIGPPARLGYEVERARAETALRDAQLERRLAEGNTPSGS
jgi:nitroreductase